MADVCDESSALLLATHTVHLTFKLHINHASHPHKHEKLYQTHLLVPHHTAHIVPYKSHQGPLSAQGSGLAAARLTAGVYCNHCSYRTTPSQQNMIFRRRHGLQRALESASMFDGTSLILLPSKIRAVAVQSDMAPAARTLTQ